MCRAPLTPCCPGATDLPLKTYGLVSRSQADKSRRDNDDDDDLLPSLGIRDLLSKWGLGNSSLAKGKKRQPLTIRLIGSKETTAVVSDKLPGSANAASGTASSSSSSSRRRPADHGERGRMAPPKNEELDEKRTIAKIDSLVTTTLEKLDGYLKKYLAQPGGDPAAAAAAAATGGEAPKLTKAENYKQHAFLSENLLQLLLKLDGIEIPNSEYTDARKFRKESIRKVQGILEQVDAVKENVGAGSTNPSSAAQSNTVVR